MRGVSLLRVDRYPASLFVQLVSDDSLFATFLVLEPFVLSHRRCALRCVRCRCLR